MTMPKSDFTILLGDNFYPSGVVSVNDPKFSYFNEFRESSDRFYVIPGNHDYGTDGSVGHQIAYSKLDAKWIFPSTYYSKILPVKNSIFRLCLIFLDTMYLKAKQLEWFESELIKCSEPNMIRIVAGHYPVYSSGQYADSESCEANRNHVKPLLTKYKVGLYLSGHEHQMQALVEHGVHYIISGASAKVVQESSEKFDHILKFQSLVFGIATFQVNPKSGVVSYQFLKSRDGSVLHKGSVNPVGVTMFRPSVKTEIIKPRVAQPAEKPKQVAQAKTNKAVVVHKTEKHKREDPVVKQLTEKAKTKKVKVVTTIDEPEEDEIDEKTKKTKEVRFVTTVDDPEEDGIEEDEIDGKKKKAKKVKVVTTIDEPEEEEEEDDDDDEEETDIKTKTKLRKRPSERGHAKSEHAITVTTRRPRRKMDQQKNVTTEEPRLITSTTKGIPALGSTNPVVALVIIHLWNTYNM
jgi:hypothetical protein